MHCDSWRTRKTKGACFFSQGCSRKISGKTGMTSLTGKTVGAIFWNFFERYKKIVMPNFNITKSTGNTEVIKCK
jgi:hypothetical protein